MNKIVITGGPCAGKSTALSRIQQAFTRMGYTVLFISETATELINSGVAPWTCGSNIDFQQCQIRMQLEKEAVYEMAAQSMSGGKILIVCDRGVIDNKAYMTDEDFQKVLRFTGTNEIALRDRYDAVFHLTTAAKGAGEYYTTANNPARHETPEEAVAVDDKLIAAWTGHPHLRVIDNSTDFEDKIKRLIAEIAFFLGEPEPLEIERKFLIAYPDMEWLNRQNTCRSVEITQTYLRVGGEEMRVRQRGSDGHYVYYQTIKRRISDLKRIEIEKRLTVEEYNNLLAKADPQRYTISKTRYCLMYDGQYFEIDIFPFWQQQALAEIELRSEDDAIRFPPELKILREVSHEEAFTNRLMAQYPERAAALR